METIVKPVFMFKPYHQHLRRHQPVDVLLQMKQLQHYLHLISASSRPVSSRRFLLTLSFANERFRKLCRSAIYAEYSCSRANGQMIRNNEHAILIKWAQDFNRVRSQFKIVQIYSEITKARYGASCLVLNLNSSSEQLSDPAYLYQFASTETKRLVRIMQATFNRCVPGINFQFLGRSLSYLQASDFIRKMRPRSSQSKTVYSAYHDLHFSASSSLRLKAPSSVTQPHRSISSSKSSLKLLKSSVINQSNVTSASLSKMMDPVAAWQDNISQQARRSLRSVSVNRSSLQSSSAVSRSSQSSALTFGRQQSLRSAEISLRRSSQTHSMVLSTVSSASRVSSSSAARQRSLIERHLQIHSSQTAAVAQHYFRTYSTEPRSVTWFVGCVIVTIFIMVLLFMI